MRRARNQKGRISDAWLGFLVVVVLFFTLPYLLVQVWTAYLRWRGYPGYG